MNIEPDGHYVDATFGRGGHSQAILQNLDSNGRVTVFDRDPEAVAAALSLSKDDCRVRVKHSQFSKMGQCAELATGEVDGVLFDLGLSSPQIDDRNRGFSFKVDGPLDMRMDPASDMSAREWINTAPEREISDVLWKYGEERASRKIARVITEQRKIAPITTTSGLAKLIRGCTRFNRSKIDPATKSFQAIRIHINDELLEIETGLEIALKLLKLGGRLLVISFHSLEDRIVKHRFRDLDYIARESVRDNRQEIPSFRLVKPKLVRATSDEKKTNPRSRSARLRSIERCL
jgi:16S rRNA (cytosine1402-N4)-methyltransferase